MTERVRFVVVRDGGNPYGIFVLPNGTQIGNRSWSQAAAGTEAIALFEEGKFGPDFSVQDVDLLAKEVETSGLPFPVAEEDHALTMEIIQELVDGLGFKGAVLFILELVPEVEQGMRAAPATAEESKDFSIKMPTTCPNGCHMVDLFRGPTLLESYAVRNVPEGNDLLRYWRKAFWIPDEQMGGLLDAMISGVEKHNAVLEAQRQSANKP